MGFVRNVAWMFVVVFLSSGCASAGANRQRSERLSSYEQGYRQGVAENMQQQVEKLNGNDFPYINGTWAEPVVDTVVVPAHVRNGFFYPEHQELVVITPGAWKQTESAPLYAGLKKEQPCPVPRAALDENVDITALPDKNISSDEGK